MSCPPVRALFVGPVKEEFTVLRRLLLEDFPPGFELDRVESCEEALERAHSGLLDVVFLDCMGSQSFCRDFATRAERLESAVPIIFLGSREDPEAAAWAIGAGCGDYLSMDRLDAPSLDRTIRCSLARSRREAELRRTNELLRMLCRCSEMIGGAENEPLLLEELCRIIMKSGGYRMAWIGLPVEGQGGSMRPVAWACEGPASPEPIPIPWPVCRTGCAPGKLSPQPQTACGSDDGPLQLEFAYRHDRAIGPASPSSIVFPMKNGEQVLGTLSICASGPQAFLPDEVRLLEELAANIARGISRIRTRREQLRLSTAMEQLEEGILILGPDWKIQYVNPACERMSGYSRQEIASRHPRIMLAGKNGAPLRRAIWDTLREGHVWRGVLVLSKKGGARYQAKTAIAPIRDRLGKIANYVVINRDVTQEMEMERQVRRIQKLEAVGTLAGGIAHEFNNLLGIIMGYTELALYETPTGSPVQANLGEIIRASNRMKELVARILTFSRSIERERKPLRLGLFVADALKTLAPSFPPSIELELSTEGKNDIVLADPIQLHQALVSLANNAVDAMRSRGGKLTVQTRAVRFEGLDASRPPDIEPGEYVELLVEDSGEGIEPAHIERIFDPYFTTKPQGAGTGLGLSIVHGAVQNCGGTVTVSSMPGKGSVFRLFLPRARDWGSGLDS